MAAFQTAGEGAVGPFTAVAANPDIVAEQDLLAWAYEAGGFQSVGDFLIAIGIGVIAILLIGNAFTVFVMYWLFRYANMRRASLSRRLFDRYVDQPYAFFLDKNTSVLY